MLCRSLVEAVRPDLSPEGVCEKRGCRTRPNNFRSSCPIFENLERKESWRCILQYNVFYVIVYFTLYSKIRELSRQVDDDN